MHMVFVMENDTWRTQEWTKSKVASHVAIWRRHRELIRSLRDDEQVTSQEPGSASGCALMTRASGRSIFR